MKKSLKEQYMDKEPMAAHNMTNTMGLLLLDIVYDTDDRVVVCASYGKTERDHFHWHKVHTPPSGRSYIRKFGQRFYLDHFIRL